MAPEDGQGHTRDGSKSITLDNPANSNKPNNKENKQETEEENNSMMRMLQQIIENQREAKESTENYATTSGKCKIATRKYLRQ